VGWTLLYRTNYLLDGREVVHVAGLGLEPEGLYCAGYTLGVGDHNTEAAFQGTRTKFYFDNVVLEVDEVGPGHVEKRGVQQHGLRHQIRYFFEEGHKAVSVGALQQQVDGGELPQQNVDCCVKNWVLEGLPDTGEVEALNGVVGDQPQLTLTRPFRFHLLVHHDH